MRPPGPRDAAGPAGARIPLWLKLLWTLWVLVWAPLYWDWYGPQNFLWFCDIANLLLAVALWLESSLIFSWQAVSVLLVQMLFSLDLAWALATGSHLTGGSEYMFDGSIPLAIRLLSLFHLVTPPLLLWALRRLGYDRRALAVQTATSWGVLAICFLLFSPELDLNWVHGPYDEPQAVMPPWLYFAACLVGYPVLLYIPTHLVLSRLFANSPALGGKPSPGRAT